MSRKNLAMKAHINRLNASLKAKLQEIKAVNQFLYYRGEAVRMGVVLPEGKELVQAFRNRLKRRGISPEHENKNSLHVFLAYCIRNWETILPKVLKHFGKVTEFEWRSLQFDDRAPRWLSERERMNEAMLAAFCKAHKQRPVDIVVGYLSGYNINPLILQRMGEAGAIIFNFCWDDKLGFRGRKVGGRWSGPAALAPVVDLNLTNAPDSCLKYLVHGGLAMFWPEAADPKTHRPYDVGFEYDASFVGQKYGYRSDFIDKLREMGIQVTAFGLGWERGPLSDKEMIKVFSRSRMNLGFAGVGYSRKLMCLKGRDFEVPMSGGLYMTQDNPELALVYDVGKEIITYRDERDCKEKICYLLDHPEEAAKIRKAGRERALKDHTWERRFGQLLEMAGLFKPNPSLSVDE